MKLNAIVPLAACLAALATAVAAQGSAARIIAGWSAETAPAAARPAARRPARAIYDVIGVGDVMLGSDWPQPGMDPRVIPGANPADVIGPVLAQRFAAADVVFGNFEGTMHTSSEGAKACGNPRLCFSFRSPLFHARYLRAAGFTMMSNANNHSRDFGDSGRAATYRNLTAAGIAVAGADTEGTRIAYQIRPDGRRFALVAFGHNQGLLRVQDFDRVTAMVREAGAHADIVIVSCHIGAEGASRDQVTRANETFIGEDRGNPYKFAHTAVDAGADIVFCHGPHIPRAIEVYRGRFIAYSLGNFWTYGRFNLSGTSGLAAIAALQVDGAGELVSARILSARQDRPGGPYPDPDGGAARRIAELTARDFPEARITIDADGLVHWRR